MISLIVVVLVIGHGRGGGGRWRGRAAVFFGQSFLQPAQLPNQSAIGSYLADRLIAPSAHVPPNIPAVPALMRLRISPSHQISSARTLWVSNQTTSYLLSEVTRGSPKISHWFRVPRAGVRLRSDLEGFKKLRTMLEKYQGILEMMQPDKDEAAN